MVRDKTTAFNDRGVASAVTEGFIVFEEKEVGFSEIVGVCTVDPVSKKFQFFPIQLVQRVNFSFKRTSWMNPSGFSIREIFNNYRVNWFKRKTVSSEVFESEASNSKYFKSV